MPKRATPTTPTIPIAISSPMLRSPDAAYFPSPRATSGSSPPPDPRSVSASGRGGRKVSGRGKGEDAVDGLGLGMELGVGGFNEVGLTLLILFAILGRTQGEEDGEESWNR